MMKHAKLNQSASKVESKGLMIKQSETFFTWVEVEGTAPLIQNAFSSKAIEQMLKKHMGIAVAREKKKPRELIEDAKVLNTKGEVCISTVSFKKAMLCAAADIKGMKKTNLQRNLHVVGHGLPVQYHECVPRMDYVRLAGIGRVPDVRFRPMFTEWRVRMMIEFSDQLQSQTVLELLQRAGRSGVGEWRPERGGTFGTFRIARIITEKEEADEIYELSMTPLVVPKIPDWALDADVDMSMLQKVMDEAVADTRDKRGDSSEDGEEDEDTGT